MTSGSSTTRSPLKREVRFQPILRERDTFRVGTLILDEDLSVVWASRDVADFFGVSPGELVGRKQPSLIDSTLKPLLEDPEPFAETVRASYRDDAYIESLECRVLPGENREERQLLYRSDPLRDGPFQGGRIEHFTDVTAYRDHARELNQLNELHRAVLSTIRDTVVVTDEEDRFTYICPNVSFIFGYDREAVAELGTAEALFGQRLFDPVDLEPEGELKNIEATVTDREGKEHVVLVTVARGQFHDGTILYSVRDVTDRKERETELTENREKFRTLFEAVPDPVFMLDDTGIFREINQAFVQELGYDRDEIIGRPLNGSPFLPGEARRIAADHFKRRLGGEDIPPFTLPIQRKNGEGGFAEITARALERDGEVIGEIGIARDITERKRAREALRESERRFREMATHIEEVVWLTDISEHEGLRNERIIYVSPVCKTVWGRPPEYFLDRPRRVWLDTILPEDRDRVEESFEEARDGKFDLEYRIEQPDGEIRWIHDRGFPITDEGGSLKRIAGLSLDITARKHREQELEKTRTKLEEANEQLRRQSREDELTGLANKRHFNEVLNREWARHRRTGQPLSLIMGDVDDFKAYNDAHGHEAGDRVLRTVGNTFQGQLNRPTDLPARWGGEEFAVILPDTDGAGATTVAEEIRRAIRARAIPHPDNPAADVVTMSFGTATLRPGDEREPADLVRRADAALYRSKAKLKNCVSRFDDEQPP